jgi:hypothetical protein
VERPAEGRRGDGAARRLSRPRTLPGGRAVLGALLVTVAVVGIAAAHLAVIASPDRRYLVAATELPAGTLLVDAAAVEDAFRAVAVDLPEEVAAGAVDLEVAESIVGRRTTAALAPGDLLLGSALAERGADPGSTTFTFALPPAAAVGGALTVGDRVDVVATVGTGGGATTAYVVRAAPVGDVRGAGGGLGGDQLQLTVELEDQTEVQALAHALATATVVVVRAPDDTSPAPPPYRFDPDGASAAGDTGTTDESSAAPDASDAEATDAGEDDDPPAASDDIAAVDADDAADAEDDA